MSNLKPCPFCGGEAERRRQFVLAGQPTCLVSCSICNARSANYHTRDEAEATWNTRYEQTCHNENGPHTRSFICSNCGESSSKEPCESAPKNCPSCRAKVVD